MLRKRLLLIVVIAVSLGVVAGGVLWYVRRNSGAKLLARTELAIQAGNFDTAAGVASQYIDKYPDDWRGFYFRATACLRQGRYDEARADLKQAAQRAPTGASISLLMAETYSMPAWRMLSADEALKQKDTLAKAIGQFEQALEPLSTVRTDDPKARLDVQRHKGLVCVSLATARRFLARHVFNEARMAETINNADMASRLNKNAQTIQTGADEAARWAIESLVEVVTARPTDDEAAEQLTTLCIQRSDEISLAKARTLIMSQAHPPALACMTLAMYDLQRELPDTDLAQSRQLILKTAALLDSLLQQGATHPKIMLARADLALSLDDLANASRLCDDALKAQPNWPIGLLFKGRILTKQNRFSEAEDMLSLLKTQYPSSSEVQLAYAQAALATGRNIELAKEAMRAVTKLDRDNATARKYLAESLMHDGFYDQALEEARECVASHGNDPDAITLLATVAMRMGHPEAARAWLDAAQSTYSGNALVLTALAEGYTILGDTTQASSVAQSVAKVATGSTRDRLAVARSMMLMGKNADAEKMLLGEVTSNPQQPIAHLLLGRFYESTGRLESAIEQYKQASALDPTNQAHKLILAGALVKSGDLRTCQQILSELDDSSPQANLLRRQVELLSGQPANAEQLARQLRGNPQAGLVMAQMYMQSGQPQRCADTCMAELSKTPADNNLKWLLGLACFELGQKDKGMEQWAAILQAAPDVPATYMQIAAELSRTASPREIDKTLSGIQGAKPELIDMAIGGLCQQIGDHAAAATAYAQAAGRQGAGDDVRNRAKLLCAMALAYSHNAAQAISEIEALSQVPSWQVKALLAKADICASMGPEQAKGVLASLRDTAVMAKDVNTLRTVAALYGRLKQTDNVLTVCDEITKLIPNDTACYRLKAAALSEAGRNDQAEAALRKALDIEPENVLIWLPLTRTLDANNQPAKAIEALQSLMRLGPKAQSASLFQQTAFFTQWGLDKQAIECLNKLQTTGYNLSEPLKIVMSDSLINLGQQKQAQKILAEIPERSSQYAAARLRLANLAETPQAKLGLLARLDETNPGLDAVVLMRMRLLIQTDQHAKAAELFGAYAAKRSATMPLAENVALTAVAAMWTAGHRDQAAQLADKMRKQTGEPRWRHLAQLLAIQNNTAPMLPTDKAEALDAVLGLCWAVQKNDAKGAQKWAQQIKVIDASRQQAGNSPLLAPNYAILIALATGQADEAQQALAGLASSGNIGTAAAAELLASAATNDAAAAEAARLLQAAVAKDLNLPQIASDISMEALKSRPACQWAALAAAEAPGGSPAAAKVLDILQPADCVTAKLIRAEMLMDQGKHAQAADVFGELAKADADNIGLAMKWAQALELAGQLKESLAVYRRVYQVGKSPVAANNAANLSAQLFRDDPSSLASAQQWAEAAANAGPQISQVLDTKGWIALLCGRSDQACIALRQAIKGNPHSIETHYHLGLAESAAGNGSLARWHLEAAVALAQTAKAQGANLSPLETSAADLAGKAMDNLGPVATSEPATAPGK